MFGSTVGRLRDATQPDTVLQAGALCVGDFDDQNELVGVPGLSNWCQQVARRFANRLRLPIPVGF